MIGGNRFPPRQWQGSSEDALWGEPSGGRRSNARSRASESTSDARGSTGKERGPKSRPAIPNFFYRIWQNLANIGVASTPTSSPFASDGGDGDGGWANFLFPVKLAPTAEWT